VASARESIVSHIKLPVRIGGKMSVMQDRGLVAEGLGRDIRVWYNERAFLVGVMVLMLKKTPERNSVRAPKAKPVRPRPPRSVEDRECNPAKRLPDHGFAGARSPASSRRARNQVPPR